MSKPCGFTVVELLAAMIPLVFGITLLVLNIIGIVQCFHAHVFLGVGSLVIQGSGIVECVGNWFGYDIAQHLAGAIGLTK